MGKTVVLRPHPRVHIAPSAFQEHLVRRPVQVVRQGNGHADGQGQHATEIACISVVILQPPAGTRLSNEAMHVQLRLPNLYPFKSCMAEYYMFLGPAA